MLESFHVRDPSPSPNVADDVDVSRRGMKSDQCRHGKAGLVAAHNLTRCKDNTRVYDRLVRFHTAILDWCSIADHIAMDSMEQATEQGH